MTAPDPNPARAARHAALTPRLEALQAQVAAVAKTRPGEAVAGVVAALAGDLLFEAREFRPRGERRGLPAVAPDHAGLAAHLGQALAMLALWRARHPPPGASSDRRTPAEVEAMRRKLARRLDELVMRRLRLELRKPSELTRKALSDQALEDSYPRPSTSA